MDSTPVSANHHGEALRAVEDLGVDLVDRGEKREELPEAQRQHRDVEQHHPVRQDLGEGRAQGGHLQRPAVLRRQRLLLPQVQPERPAIPKRTKARRCRASPKPAMISAPISGATEGIITKTIITKDMIRAIARPS
jgi:hypothetical protein